MESGDDVISFDSYILVLLIKLNTKDKFTRYEFVANKWWWNKGDNKLRIRSKLKAKNIGL